MGWHHYYTGVLQSDGTVHWSDGDVWVREDTCHTVVAEAAAGKKRRDGRILKKKGREGREETEASSDAGITPNGVQSSTAACAALLQETIEDIEHGAEPGPNPFTEESP